MPPEATRTTYILICYLKQYQHGGPYEVPAASKISHKHLTLTESVLRNRRFTKLN